MAKTPKFANAKVFDWVDKWNKICTPDKIVVVTGTNTTMRGPSGARGRSRT